eukprot:605364-Pyramimonas_sp.AAC.1
MGLCDGILWNDTDDLSDIDAESLDISTAFLQGLDCSELSANARTLGYEYRHKRECNITPPENVWRHFRNMKSANKELEVSDSEKGLYVLLCLRAMYGFTDASLAFPLALFFCLPRGAGAASSFFDDVFLYLTVPVDGVETLALIMTAYVGDLQSA